VTAAAGDSALSRDTRRTVARVRARAARAPTPGDISRLIADASRHAGDLSQDDIKAIGAVAIKQATQISYLLGRLAGLLGEDGESHA
jgi:hypothetical protein